MNSEEIKIDDAYSHRRFLVEMTGVPLKTRRPLRKAQAASELRGKKLVLDFIYYRTFPCFMLIAKFNAALSPSNVHLHHHAKTHPIGCVCVVVEMTGVEPVSDAGLRGLLQV